MNEPSRLPRSAVVFLHICLSLYPRRFRAAFREEMLDVFRAQYASVEEESRGVARRLKLILLSVRTGASLLRNGLAERTARSFVGGEIHEPRAHSPAPGVSASNGLLREVGLAFRSVRRQPGFTAVAVLTLGLGIGANSAIFGLVRGVLLQPLAYPEPDDLVSVWTSNIADDVDRWGVSLHDYTDWRERAGIFQSLGAYNVNSVNLSVLDRAERVTYTQVTPDFFEALGTQPLAGRVFTEEDNLPGNDAVVIVTHAFWQGSMGGRDDAVGTRLTIDGRPMTIVGVMPPAFTFPTPTVQLWKPFGMRPEDEGSRAGRWVRAIGRLAPGIDLATARGRLATLGAILERDFPETNTGYGIYTEPLLETTVQSAEQTLYILWATAGFVLLIASSNLANLLLARGTSRSREIAVRAALGASRGRIARQLTIETVPLALIGAGVGVVFGWVGIRVLSSLGGAQIPRLNEVAIDTPVLAYSVIVSLAVAVLFSLLPAHRASSFDLATSFKEGAKGTQGARGTRLRAAFVIVQIALAVIVVIGSGLLFRSLQALAAVELGFVHENMLTVRVAPSWSEIAEREEAGQLFADIETSLETLPFVAGVSAVNAPPLAGNRWGTTVEIAGRPDPEADNRRRVLTRVALPDYHETMGISLVRGRSLRDTDHAASPQVVVINQAMADAWWPDSDPIGDRIRGDSPDFRTIVGVVADVPVGLGWDPTPIIYVPFAQGRFGHFQDWGMTFVIRTRDTSEDGGEAVRTAINRIAPSLPVFDVAAIDGLVGNWLAGQRFVTLVLATFAGVGLLLAAVGVYAVMAYVVAQQTREIGIRVALGAAGGRVVRLFIARGMTLALLGMLGGITASLYVTRFLESQLFETSPIDPLTYGVVAFVLGAILLAACGIPALRATRVSPVEALRAE